MFDSLNMFPLKTVNVIKLLLILIFNSTTQFLVHEIYGKSALQ